MGGKLLQRDPGRTLARRVLEHNGLGANDSGKGQFPGRKDPAVGGFKGAAVFEPALQNLTVTRGDVGGDDFGAQEPSILADDENEAVGGSRVIDFDGGGHFHRGRQVSEPAGRIHWRRHWFFQRTESCV